MQRRLAAILAADVVGYSRLVGQDEQATLTAFKALRVEFVEPLVASHRGRIVKLMGDGYLIEFASAVDAVGAAVAWQMGLRGRAEPVPLVFRIGINLGDIVFDDGDIHGDGVNVAARLEGVAEPGGVCIADIVHQSVAGKTDAAFVALGELDLKNIERKVMAWRWDVDAIGGAGTHGGGRPASRQPSVAVLPFDDMSSDPEQAYFCDGITEDLITELAHVPGLVVIARHSSFAYRGKSVDARRIGAELGVAHLVEGSVRRAGARVRITAQLIDVRDGSHLWAQRYDRDIDDIFAVQDDVVAQIAAALSSTLERPGLSPPASAHPRNLEAYQLVMRGRQNILRAQGREQARRDLEAAISLDPKLSDAHAWLAMYHYSDWFLYHREPRREGLAAAFAAADTAIDLDPGNWLAHMALGMVSLYAGRRATGLQSMSRALELNPNEADAHCFIQEAYTFDGQPQKGADSVRTAMRLNRTIRNGMYGTSASRCFAVATMPAWCGNFRGCRTSRSRCASWPPPTPCSATRRKPIGSSGGFWKPFRTSPWRPGARRSRFATAPTSTTSSMPIASRACRTDAMSLPGSLTLLRRRRANSIAARAGRTCATARQPRRGSVRGKP